jgi:outer membrane protein assembly factor BamA
MVGPRQTAFAKCAAILLGIALAATGAMPAAARVLPSFNARAPRPEEPRPPNVPSDAELERLGARIGTIHFNGRQLFDLERQDENTALARVANRLHVPTRESTIETQLLFKSGDFYRPELLAESARILRDTRYLREARVRPVAFHDGLVDVEVTTQEVWTFNPGISFGRHGGKNTAGVELEDLNFLGLGTQLGVGLKSGVDRDSKFIHYRDRQLGESWWDLAAGYSDNSDGRLAEFSLERPFYALDARWAAGFAFSDDRRLDSRYDLGEVVDRFETREKVSSIYWGTSRGLVGKWVRRLTFGLTHDQHEFGPADDAIPRLLPSDRTLVYPWVAAEWVEDEFRTERNRNQIGKTEDFSLGWYARAQLGFAGRSLGSDRDAFVFSGKLAKGLSFGDRQSLFVSLDTQGRVEDGGVADGLLGAAARYYFRQSPRRLLYLGASGEVGRNLDVDHQLLLGGDNGLRGYPLRYQAGEGRWLVTAEQRFFTDWYPFRLFNVGAAVFADVGATFGHDPLGAPSQGVLRDIGFGLRLGNNRSALGNLLHIDIAFPLDGDPSIRNVQFLVETKKSF